MEMCSDGGSRCRKFLSVRDDMFAQTAINGIMTNLDELCQEFFCNNKIKNIWLYQVLRCDDGDVGIDLFLDHVLDRHQSAG